MSTRSPASSLLLGFLLLQLAAMLHAGDIAVYWGQNRREGSLKTACSTGLYDIINIAYLTGFGNFRTPQLDLAGHCDPRFGCLSMAEEIRACQDIGVKVLLSLGGPSGRYGLQSKNDAQYLASYVWNSYLGGLSLFRPFGIAVLDGVNLDIEGGSQRYYDAFASYFRDIAGGDQSRKYYLTASPDCHYPPHYLGPAIYTGLMDYIWVKFYDDYDCQYSISDDNDELLLNSWNQWQNVDGSKLFLGLPASANAFPHGGGFIPPKIFVDRILPVVQHTPNYGGVMLWSRYYDIQTNYSVQIKDYIVGGSPSVSVERAHLSMVD